MLLLPRLLRLRLLLLGPGTAASRLCGCLERRLPLLLPIRGARRLPGCLRRCCSSRTLLGR
jgi:hypothetical protein